MDAIPIGVARAVLGQETHDKRFEAFCCELVSEIEGGLEVLPTSMSYDRGRDGRSVGGPTRVLLCATLGTRLEPKVLDDIQKILDSGIKFAKVYYCTGREPASEATLDSICEEILPLLPAGAEIEPLSGGQLARLCGHFPSAMWKYYRADVEDTGRNIVGDGVESESMRSSLLLALATAAHDDSTAIRTACYETILLRVLQPSPQTLNEITKLGSG